MLYIQYYQRKPCSNRFIKLTTTPSYTRKPLEEVVTGNKQTTRTIILSRHGMLECGANYKGTMPETCRHCDAIDNESHRLNECTNWEHLNRAGHQEKCHFNDIYSEDIETVNNIIEEIEKVWEFRHTNG